MSFQYPDGSWLSPCWGPRKAGVEGRSRSRLHGSGTKAEPEQVRALVGELLTQLPGLAAGEPDYLQGNFVHAIRSLPVTF